MAASQRLRIGDVQAVCQLVGQCRELGADARAWQQHLLRELRRITGCKMAGIIETVPTPRGLASNLATELDQGWTDSEKKAAFALLSSGEFPPDEFCLRLSRRFVATQPQQLTLTRSQLIDDSQWFGSATCEVYRQTGASDIVMSLVRISETQRTLCIGLTRALGERCTSIRQVRMLDLLSRLLRPHLGLEMALLGEPGIAELSSRKCQVLAGLLEGLSEKQIARRLDLSPATVHEYVSDLHRHFRVSSRGELMALFLRRLCGPAERWLQRITELARRGCGSEVLSRDDERI
ncbi:MAG TPA: LuxR C-terminal-related transcriptional regulator [Tepidisphaeraceae bacterium]|nr:LuxR C-terminal-related transcriptional regulator [Tepidisphaeraceae bacterium]